MATLSQGAGSQPSTSSANTTSTDYTVRVPNDGKKKFSMIKFSSGTDIDFLKLTQTTVHMERENNLREYKASYNMDNMPKFGAGSEYGREQKEEARRKKYGINRKAYNSEDQPWHMKVGSGKNAKKFKGVREGTITANTSYYIFTQCADGAFEAHPISEWYNFQPVIKYKYLNSEEAEEEFNKRDRTMNLFSVMVRKRVKNEKESADPDEGEKKSATKMKKNKSLILTDMDDWGESSDDDEADDEDENAGKPKPEKKKKTKAIKRRKNAKHNLDDEAIEESDEGDFDDKEVDYITDSGESDSEDEKVKQEKYDDQGVDQEAGLKKLIDSGESSEGEAEANKEEEDGEVEDDKGPKKKKEGEESESSSSSSGSDSDIEKEEKISSVLFMQKKKGGSRSNTPTIPDTKDNTDGKSEEKDVKREAIKRAIEPEESDAKKMRTDSPLTNSAISSGEITEETIRRYLMRKPMTAKELVQKFKSKKPQLTKEQMTHKIGQLLKKINPDRKYVNNILYLSVKKTG